MPKKWLKAFKNRKTFHMSVLTGKFSCVSWEIGKIHRPTLSPDFKKKSISSVVIFSYKKAGFGSWCFVYHFADVDILTSDRYASSQLLESYRLAFVSDVILWNSTILYVYGDSLLCPDHGCSKSAFFQKAAGCFARRRFPSSVLTEWKDVYCSKK